MPRKGFLTPMYTSRTAHIYLMFYQFSHSYNLWKIWFKNKDRSFIAMLMVTQIGYVLMLLLFLTFCLPTCLSLPVQLTLYLTHVPIGQPISRSNWVSVGICAARLVRQPVGWLVIGQTDGRSVCRTVGLFLCLFPDQSILSSSAWLSIRLTVCSCMRSDERSYAGLLTSNMCPNKTASFVFPRD